MINAGAVTSYERVKSLSNFIIHKILQNLRWLNL